MWNSDTSVSTVSIRETERGSWGWENERGWMDGRTSGCKSWKEEIENNEGGAEGKKGICRQTIASRKKEKKRKKIVVELWRGFLRWPRLCLLLQLLVRFLFWRKTVVTPLFLVFAPSSQRRQHHHHRPNALLLLNSSSSFSSFPSSSSSYLASYLLLQRPREARGFACLSLSLDSFTVICPLVVVVVVVSNHFFS